jgi:lipid-A-disaccharide synthase
VSALLVVAGEASGDRAAAAVVARLQDHAAFGLGGPALARAGTELVSDLRDVTAMGIGEASRRAFATAIAFARVLRGVRARRPKAALLVGYTEFNARIAPWLRRAGARVVWYCAPQVWAWRPGRAKTLAPLVDRMAVVLPFEARLWRNAGADATYVGHPALETPLLPRADARRALGMTPYASGIAILPGSRPHEVRRLLPPMLAAYRLLFRDRAAVDARILVAPSLDAGTRRHVQSLAERNRVATYDVDPADGAMPVLPAFEAALCASGTASLEAAIAEAVPVVAYRVGLTTEIAARVLLRVPHIALPNILLGRSAFAEVLQRDVAPQKLHDALARALDDRAARLVACREVAAVLGDERRPSARVAEMLAPWL